MANYYEHFILELKKEISWGVGFWLLGTRKTLRSRSPLYVAATIDWIAETERRDVAKSKEVL